MSGQMLQGIVMGIAIGVLAMTALWLIVVEVSHRRWTRRRRP